ncbi:MAG: xanthine dehydrogenase family protein molybdopterin-binding subunit [Dehalococcoidia bacterium]
MVSYRVIGKPTPRVDGVAKVTGAAMYAADVPLTGVLWGKVLHSPYAHARILRIDTSAAEALPGVVAVITGADTGSGLYGRMSVRDVPPLARDRVRFFGERVAAVAAEDEDTAQRAIDLIEVEYEELPAVFTAEDALNADAPVLHPDYATYRGATPGPWANSYAYSKADRGDLEAGFAEADEIVERVYSTQRVHQGYMETQAVSVHVVDDIVQVWAASKVPYNLRDSLATAVGIPVESVVVNHSFIGGDFGGKGTPPDLPIAYYLSKKSGRPVRIVPDYLEEFLAGDPRHQVDVKLRTGVKRDGTLVAHHVMFRVNCGAYAGFKPRGAIGGAAQSAGPYRIPNTRVESLHVYTNTIPGGHMRAPGEPQGMFAIESHLDEVAKAIGMDPVDLRVRNLIEDGEESAAGEVLHDVHAKSTLWAAVKAAGYYDAKAPNVGRGVAIGDRGPGGGVGTAQITLRQDGSAVLHTPVFDQGTGTYTTLRQVVAEEIGIDPQRIQVEVWSTDTDLVETDSGLGGSRGTRVNSYAAHVASQNLKSELKRLAARELEWPEDAELVYESGRVFRHGTGESASWQEIAARAGGEVTAVGTVDDSERLDISGFSVQVAEVAVDPETGEITLKKFTTAHDVGRIMNPVGHQGQINGGFMQGLGYALMEELQVDDGRVTTLSFGDYKIPTTRDLPRLETVLVEHESGAGPYAVKGIGENAIGPVAPAIANAIANATGVRIPDLPLTAEKVYRRLKG